jgi:anti-sigma regulatory factor (Ser/Thr protein kinase)
VSRLVKERSSDSGPGVVLSAARTALREVAGPLRRRHAHPSGRGLDDLSFVADASLVLGSSLDPRRVADLIASLAVPRLGEGAMVWLRDGDDIRLGSLVHTDPEMAARIRAIVAVRPPRITDNAQPGSVLRHGQTFYLPYLTPAMMRRLFGDEDVLRMALEATAGAWVTVPMSARGRVFGALTVTRPAGSYTGHEVELAEDLARRGAVALDNAQLFRDVQDSALALQRSFLPAHPPALEGAEVAMEYRPGMAGTEVGGDLYDVIPLSRGRVGVAIGDIMGRGLHAAAVMGQLRAAVRAYALEEWRPADLLARLDRVVDALPGLQLATCIYGVYDPCGGRITLANAGHLAPLVVLPDEDPDYLVLDPGLPLGVGVDTGFSETTVSLPPGSGIVLFTDGLVESRRRALADGLDRMRRGVREQVGRRRSAQPPPGSAGSPVAPPGGGHSGVAPNPMGGRAGGVAPATAAPGGALPEGVDRPDPSTDRRTGADRRAGSGGSRAAVDRRRGGDRRRRVRGGFSARSWSGPAAVAPDDERWSEGSARTLLELCLVAADLPASTDDDIALLVLTTRPVRPPLLELALPPVAASAGQARIAVEALLAEHRLGPAEDATLLVSEVVTNAVRHARSDLVLRASMSSGPLRISVEDREGGTLPRPGSSPGDEAESGWGLLLVEALSEAWGVETTPGGKRVWFDLEVSPGDDDAGGSTNLDNV